MKDTGQRHKDRVIALLADRGMARLTELKAAGVIATSVSLLERNSDILRLSRGFYQLPDAPVEAGHALAAASKLIPRGVVCLTSALAFHDLTDTMPAKVWIAIARTDRASLNRQPPCGSSGFPQIV